jgi:hypothetical protein
VFALSYSQHGHLAPDFVDDAHRASIAYFRTFLPEQLDRRAQLEHVEHPT